MSVVPALRRWRDEHGVRMAKYLTGSVAATVVSTVTFAATFGPGLLGSKGASLTASATGAVTNYFLNRRWTWGRRGRAHLWHELVPYWTTIVVTAVIAAAVTDGVNAVGRHLTADRGVRTVANTCAFLSTYCALFIVKYRIFDRLFAAAHRRDQAPTQVGDDRQAESEFSAV